jgi:hypothetical protein
MIASKIIISILCLFAATLGLACAVAIARWRDAGIGRRTMRHTPADPHLCPFGDVPRTDFIARDLATRSPAAIDLVAYANDAGAMHARLPARRRPDDYRQHLIRGIELAIAGNERLDFERRLLSREIRIRKLREAAR